jgi:hypothetical protein
VFGNGESYVERVHVSLVTPAAFLSSRSRFYAYKFQEYRDDPSALLRDLRASRLEPAYPDEDLPGRLDQLSLHWVSYDSLFEAMPESDLADAVGSFRDRFDRSRDAA